MAAFRRAVDLEPDKLWRVFDVITVLRDSGKLGEALATAQELVGAHPEFASGWALLGRMRSLRRESKDAVEAFRRAADIDADNPERGAALIHELRNQAQLPEALSSAQALVEAHPDFPDAWTQLGRVHHQLGDRAAALGAFRRAAELQPENVSHLIDCAAELRELGQFDLSEACLLAALARDPLNAGAQVGLARHRRATGQPDKALEAYRQVAKLAPTDAWLHGEFAQCLRENGHGEEALRVVQELAARMPRSGTARQVLASELRSAGRRSESSSALREALELEPWNLSLRHASAMEALEAWRLDEAEAGFHEILREVPHLSAALSGLGKVARARGDHVASLSFFRDALKTEFTPELCAEIVEEFAHLEAYSEARAFLADAATRSQASATLWVQAGYSAREAGDRADASAAFALATKKFPRHGTVMAEFARDRFDVGDVVAGLSALSEALKINADDPVALKVLAQRLLDADRLADSLAVLEHRDRVAPGDLVTGGEIARLHAALGNPELGFEMFERLLQQIGEHPELSVMRSSLFQSVGYVHKAAEEADRALALFPESMSLRIHRANLAIDLGDCERALGLLGALRNRSAKERREIQYLQAKVLAERYDFKGALALIAPLLTHEQVDSRFSHFAAHVSVCAFQIEEARKYLNMHIQSVRTAVSVRGGSLNSSQSHYGQLIDEWVLDSEAFSALSYATNLTGVARIPAIADVVRRFPDHTGAALALFSILRQERQLASLDFAASRATKRRIPKQIAQFWTEEKLPDDLQGLCSSWATKNAGYEYKLFSLRSATEFLTKYLPDPVVRAFQRSREPAQKADLFRLAWLYVEGGFYADADDRCMESLEKIDVTSFGLLVYQENFGSIANNFIGAAPRHPIIGAALNNAVSAINRGGIEVLWLSTGPGLITRAAAQVVARTPELSTGAADMFLLSRGELARAVGIHCLASYKFTSRHWTRTAYGRSGTKYDPQLDGLLGLAGHEPKKIEARRLA